jgi:hypothetical protein
VTLSRTARILIALLLVAAAAFVWVNFFTGAPDTPASPTVQAPAQPGTSADGADGAADTPTVVVPDDAPTVVAPSDGTVVGREVEVAELPFLIDQPPSVELPADGDEDGAAAGLGRPGGDARASVNPFAPVVAPPSPVAAPAPAQAASPEVETVDVPDAPQVQDVAAQVPVPPAPAPRALAPAGTPTASLPRTLAAGTLPVVPSVLRDTRAEPLSPTPIDLPQRTAIREPAGPAGTPPLPTLAGSQTDTVAEPAPLAPGAVPAAGTPDQPLVAGADGLARYLRDRNVAFTGSVVGSVGVGVFRVAGTTAPIVLALGQTLPDTEIVLTALRGQTAEFTLGDTTHVLTLDLRR